MEMRSPLNGIVKFEYTATQPVKRVTVSQDHFGAVCRLNEDDTQQLYSPTNGNVIFSSDPEKHMRSTQLDAFGSSCLLKEGQVAQLYGPVDQMCHLDAVG